jgi:hypothetical protein
MPNLKDGREALKTHRKRLDERKLTCSALDRALARRTPINAYWRSGLSGKPNRVSMV